MNNADINNHFGDMDLFLMDAILKGHLPGSGSLLDAGCGEGRNGIYFIRKGYDYLGIDKETSSLKLLEYLSRSLNGVKAAFESSEIQHFASAGKYDVILCSRVLHFARDEEDFARMWLNLSDHLKTGGVMYISMDSAMENTLARPLSNGMYEFPDGKIRFCLTESIYGQIKKEFEEIEPLRTVVHHQERAQSFLLLRKT